MPTPPHDPRLSKLLLGELPPEEAERWAESFVHDTQVVAAAEGLPSDTLLELLKGASTQEDVAADQLSSRIVERLHQTGTFSGTPAAEDDGPMPETLEYFRVVKVLGRGGMGTVYQADDTRLNRAVAVKTLRASSARKPAARERFLREARAAAAVEHENLVSIHSVGEADGIPFLAMPLLKGRGLDGHLAAHGGRLPVGEAVRVAAQVCAGLAAAHAAGLVHRDIKPSNIWIDADGRRVLVLDFGLARFERDDAHLTDDGAVVGTPAYMAPEQARGEPITARADLFSLGAVLYQMLTGRRPFDGANAMTVFSRMAFDTPPPPAELNPDCPPALSELVMKLLAINPADRPASAADVRAALARIEPRTVPAPRRKFPAVVVAVAVGLLALGGLAAFMLTFTTPDGTLEVEADDAADVRFKNGKLEVYDDKGVLKYTLQPGEKNKQLRPGVYTVRVVGADGLRLDTDTFELEKNGKVVLKVTAAAPTTAAKADPQAAWQPTAEQRKWAEHVATLPAGEQYAAVIAELRKRNPEFVGKGARNAYRIDGEAVVELTLDGNLTDLSPVRALTGLKSLNVQHVVNDNATSFPLVDLAPLRGMSLTTFVLKRAQVQDLAPLKGMPLNDVNLFGTPVTDLTPLAGMPLERLDIRECPVLDLTPLMGMKLSHLDLFDTQVSDLSALKGMPLTSLICSNLVSDLSPLKGMKLVSLECQFSKVSDLGPLKGMPLETFWGVGSKATDLTPLKDAPLKELFWHYKAERDGELLRGIKTLERINDQPAKDVLK